MKIKEFPDRKEVVVVKIKKILPEGAYVELLEYPGKEGFVHISKIASRWVKNIRKFVKEGQLKVGIIDFIDREKGIINISFRKVNSMMEKEKLEEYKREVRADKMFKHICDKLGEDFNDKYKEIAIPLIKKYGDLYTVFEMLAYGEEVPELTGKWLEELQKLSETIKPKEIDLKVEIKLKIPTGDGINKIKEILSYYETEKNYNIQYIASPKYLLKYRTGDYKKGESKIKNDMEELEKKVLKYKGSFEYKRIYEN